MSGDNTIGGIGKINTITLRGIDGCLICIGGLNCAFVSKMIDISVIDINKYPPA
ncbi:hypothetical protein AB7W15_10730 [Morganella morganii]|uniref:hypothetical protein n=1 Tax=Morganella morganii TaxID=582 RepID=UPI00319EF50E